MSILQTPLTGGISRLEPYDLVNPTLIRHTRFQQEYEKELENRD